MRRRDREVELWKRTAWQCASLLIAYPDERLLADRPLLRAAAATLPEPASGPLGRFLDHLDATRLAELAAAYVRTFDHQRRCCPYLTYYAHGDTRKRGMALLRFKQTYLRAGYQLPESGDGAELPDHLCVVLEFGATVDPDAGWRLLTDHRAGLELLRLALRDSGSPWGAAVDVVSATLPRLRGDEMDVVRRLAAQGPPEEEVGVAAYGDPDLLPFPSMPTRSGGPA